MQKIQKRSKIFRIIFQILFCLQPVIVMFFWMTYKSGYGFLSNIVRPDFTIPDGQITVNIITRIMGVGVSIPSMVVVMYGFYLIIKILKNYEREQIFTADNAMLYRRLGMTVIVWKNC